MGDHINHPMLLHNLIADIDRNIMSLSDTERTIDLNMCINNNHIPAFCGYGYYVHR